MNNALAQLKRADLSLPGIVLALAEIAAKQKYSASFNFAQNEEILDPYRSARMYPADNQFGESYASEEIVDPYRSLSKNSRLAPSENLSYRSLIYDPYQVKPSMETRSAKRFVR